MVDARLAREERRAPAAEREPGAREREAEVQAAVRRALEPVPALGRRRVEGRDDGDERRERHEGLGDRQPRVQRRQREARVAPERATSAARVRDRRRQTDGRIEPAVEGLHLRRPGGDKENKARSVASRRPRTGSGSSATTATGASADAPSAAATRPPETGRKPRGGGDTRPCAHQTPTKTRAIAFCTIIGEICDGAPARGREPWNPSTCPMPPPPAVLAGARRVGFLGPRSRAAAAAPWRWIST